MINISMQQLIDIWVELENAYNGINGYGGTVAEIYAFRLMPYNSIYASGNRTGPIGGEEAVELECNAAVSLFNILKLFEKKRNCIIYIEDVEGKRRLGKWLLKTHFQHRIHIEVKKGVIKCMVNLNYREV